MEIVHKHLPDGSFLAGDRDTRITCLAHAESPYAEAAHQNPTAVATEMLEGERKRRPAKPDRKFETRDRVGWAWLGGSS